MNENNKYMSIGNVNYAQIGGKNNKMIFSSHEDDAEWERIKQIFDEASRKYDRKQSEFILTQEAVRYSKERNKVELGKLIKEYFEEFTKSILTGAAAQVVLKFLNIT